MDEQFKLLRQRYRERAGERLLALDRALAAGDCAAAENIAHKLAGSGASFGFPQVSQLAEPLELAANAGADIADLRHLAEPLLAELGRIAQAV